MKTHSEATQTKLSWKPGSKRADGVRIRINVAAIHRDENATPFLWLIRPTKRHVAIIAARNVLGDSPVMKTKSQRNTSARMYYTFRLSEYVNGLSRERMSKAIIPVCNPLTASMWLRPTSDISCLRSG